MWEENITKIIIWEEEKKMNGLVGELLFCVCTVWGMSMTLGVLI
jgi:hypothetical protein